MNTKLHRVAELWRGPVSACAVGVKVPLVRPSGKTTSRVLVPDVVDVPGLRRDKVIHLRMGNVPLCHHRGSQMTRQNESAGGPTANIILVQQS